MTRSSLLLIACAGLWSCAGGENGETDTGVDPDVPSDQTDADGVDAADADGEEVAQTCEGTETLTIEFLDPDEAPIEGVVVALECGDSHVEATSGADGRVSFSDLNLSAVPVDFTYVHDGTARTWLDAGGPSRTLPDPLSLTLGTADPDPMVTMQGDLVHSATDSLMLLVTEGGGIDLTTETRYQLDTQEGTGLVMFVIEWTTDGEQGTPVGYQVVTYDSPASGVDGPVVGPATETLSTVVMELDFNIDPESQIMSADFSTDTPYSNRLVSGARCVGLDADEDFLFFGLTLSWTGGFSNPDLTVAWIPEGITASDQFLPDLWLVDSERNSWAIFELPPDPSSWTTFTVNDTPTIPGADLAVPYAFDEEFTVSAPDWATFFVSYHIRLPESGGALFQDHYQWSVIVHPETRSFRFPDLPWPEGMEYTDVLMSAGTLRFGYSARAYDADPFADYILWTDDTWAESHHLASMGDSRYIIQRP